MFRMLRGALPDDCYIGGRRVRRGRARADGRAGALRGRAQRRGRAAGRGRRRPLRRAAGCCWGRSPRLCRLCRVARAAARGGDAAPGRTRRCSTGSASACPRASRCWATRWRARTTTCAPGHRRYNFVWYRPADEAAALPDLLTDAAGHTHAQSIPPPLIRPAVLDAMRADAAQTLAPAFADVVAATPLPFLQPIYDLESPRLVSGRAVLLGDAAFVVRPHVGAGVTKAAEDAACLAARCSTARTSTAACAATRRSACPAGRRLVQRGRHLGAYLQAPHRNRRTARGGSPPPDSRRR